MTFKLLKPSLVNATKKKHVQTYLATRPRQVRARRGKSSFSYNFQVQIQLFRMWTPNPHQLLYDAVFPGVAVNQSQGGTQMARQTALLYYCLECSVCVWVCVCELLCQSACLPVRLSPCLSGLSVCLSGLTLSGGGGGGGLLWGNSYLTWKDKVKQSRAKADESINVQKRSVWTHTLVTQWGGGGGGGGFCRLSQREVH